MSFLPNCFQPVSQPLPGKPSCVWLITWSMWSFFQCTHTHTHIQSHLSARSFPHQQCSTCRKTSLTEYRKGKLFVFMFYRQCVCVCVRACASMSVFEHICVNDRMRGCVNGTVLIFQQASVWWGMSHPDGDPEEDWQVDDSSRKKNARKTKDVCVCS